MGRRRHSREVALQVLYQMEVTGAAPEEAVDLYFEHFDTPEPVRPFAEDLVRGVYTNKADIDRMISSASEHWRLERMSVVDRSILRIAVYEMLHCPDIPPKVSVNEAIDLGKTFGSEDSGAFINGVLDHILLQLNRDGQTVAS